MARALGLAGPGRRIQLLYDTDYTAADYVKRKAWWDASAPAKCPYHPQGGCRLVPHGSYGRKFPHGVRVRRFLCRKSGQTVSLLPKCLAAHWSGTLAEVEQTVRAAGQAASQQAAAKQLSAEYISPPGALRWLRRRLLAVRAFLQAVRTVCPQRCGQLEPDLAAFSERLGGQAVLAQLRVLAGPSLSSLPAPVGFQKRWNPAGKCAPAHAQHAQGLDPPPESA